MECPCKGCVPPKRQLCCHQNCDEYIAWKATRDDLKKRIEHYKRQQDALYNNRKKK